MWILRRNGEASLTGEDWGSSPTTKPAIHYRLPLRAQQTAALEARKLCKVGTWYNSVEETLQKNDMPPNPAEFNSGFLTWPTDGKKPEPVIAGDSHPIAACMIAPEPVRKAQEALMVAKK